MADPKRDGYEPPVVDSSEPTTVAGWIVKLSGLGFKRHAATRLPKAECNSWIDLFDVLSRHASDGITSKRYWLGAYMFCTGQKVPEHPYIAVAQGYNDAKAAFEALEQSPENVFDKSPEKVYSDVLQMVAGEGISPETHGVRWVERDGKLVYEFYELPELPNGDKPFAVAYTSIHPDDLAELMRKAAMWDAHEANRRAMISETNQWIAEVDVLWEKFKEIKKGFGI